MKPFVSRSLLTFTLSSLLHTTYASLYLIVHTPNQRPQVSEWDKIELNRIGKPKFTDQLNRSGPNWLNWSDLVQIEPNPTQNGDKLEQINLQSQKGQTIGNFNMGVIWSNLSVTNSLAKSIIPDSSSWYLQNYVLVAEAKSPISRVSCWMLLYFLVNIERIKNKNS